MSQKFQSLLFFLAAVSMGVLLFAPLADFASELEMWKFNIYGVTSELPGFEVPFSRWYALPLLLLTIVSLLLAFYVMTGLFRAVRIKDFSRLLTISRITTLVIVAWVATAFAFYIPNITSLMKNINPGSPTYKWGVFMPLVALLLNIAATYALKKDLVKVRSANRIR